MACRFDNFLFDRERGLFEDSRAVPLEPRVFELLAYLLDHRDRVVSRDELIENVWHGRVVSDAALSTQIRSLRRALGDDRTQQRFVRTYPKRGFQFVGEAQPIGSAAAMAPEQGSDAEPAEPRAAARRGRRPRPVLLALPVLAVALALAAWWATYDPGPRAVAPPAKLSIAVLPFENLSGDPAQAYFADAFTEDLITDLSRIRDAFVIARRTSFAYKDRDVDAGTVVEELGVRYVLEGSVRRSGDRVRVNAQLIDGRTNRNVWSDRFDTRVDEVFFSGNELTGHIASVLKAELREADSRRSGPPESLAAWDYALKGNVLLFNPDGPQDFREAQALLERAVELDPGISSAWSGLAFVHFAASVGSIPGISSPESKDRSLRAARKAVAADPKNAEGHWMVGVGYARNGELERAWASCETAMDLNPNNDCAYVCAGLAAMAQGRPRDAIPYFQHSLRLNPRFRPFTKYKYMGLAYLHSGQNAEAVEMLNRALAASPGDSMARLALAAALAHQGELEAAHGTVSEALASADRPAPTLAALRASHGWMGPGFERVLEGLRAAGIPSE